MPMSHKDLWVKIKRESKGKAPSEELRLLRRYLSDWPEYKGPYQELRKKLERRVEELERVGRVLATHSGHTDPFSVKKRGLAEVALVGLPNVGKTSVFRTLTGSDAEVADYPYTTLVPNVGMFVLGGFGFELVDLPPFPEGSLDEVHYAAGLKEAVLNADLICLVVDVAGDAELQLNVLREHLRGLSDAALSKGAVAVGTRADAAGDGVAGLASLSGLATFGYPLGEGGKRLLGEALCDLIGRVVVDARDPASKEEPLPYAVERGATALDLAEQIHKDLVRSARKARVWGDSAKFPGQEVGLDHVLAAGDTVEILTR